MLTQCPHCQSHDTVRVDSHKPPGGMVAGSAAGLIAGAVQAASTTRILGPLPSGGAVGMASATILGAAAGGLAGYIAGQRIANDLKASSPLRYQCLDCGLTF